MTKGSRDNGLKKAPEAPKRFKSAYMFFSIEKHKELRRSFNSKVSRDSHTTSLSKTLE
jgi:hypothetical protein